MTFIEVFDTCVHICSLSWVSWASHVKKDGGISRGAASDEWSWWQRRWQKRQGRWWLIFVPNRRESLFVSISMFVIVAYQLTNAEELNCIHHWWPRPSNVCDGLLRWRCNEPVEPRDSLLIYNYSFPTKQLTVKVNRAVWSVKRNFA